jgi:hypothetical protein
MLRTFTTETGPSGISPLHLLTISLREHRHQWEKKGVKPVFGAKSSATNVEFTVFFRASLTKSGGKKKIYPSFLSFF